MIGKNYGFLRINSRLLKISAWTFLLFGLIQAVAILARLDKNIPIAVGFVWIIISGSIFLLFNMVTLIADLLLEIWQFLKKERL
jgi:hypothetical protein